MTTIHHFGQALYAYTGASCHPDIENTDYYIIYLDSSVLFPTLDENIDCNDFGKIFLKKPQTRNQLTTGATVTTTNTGGKTDPAKLTDILEKQFQDSHDLKKENLGKWDAITQTGIPDEVIQTYDNMKDPNYIIMKTEMKQFKNVLTFNKNGCQQQQNYVLSSLTSLYFLTPFDGEFLFF